MTEGFKVSKVHARPVSLLPSSLLLKSDVTKGNGSQLLLWSRACSFSALLPTMSVIDTPSETVSKAPLNTCLYIALVTVSLHSHRKVTMTTNIH